MVRLAPCGSKVLELLGRKLLVIRLVVAVIGRKEINGYCIAVIKVLYHKKLCFDKSIGLCRSLMNPMLKVALRHDYCFK